MLNVQTDLKYMPVEQADLPTLVALYSQYLNGGDASTAHLVAAMNRPGYLGVKCMNGDRMVGVFSALPGICFTYSHPKLERQIQARWGHTKLYSVDMMVVLPEYRCRGVARSLTLGLLALLRQSGIRELLVEMWNPRLLGDRPISGIMKYLGEFQLIAECPDFYKDLYDFAMTCPDCGDGPCRCGATVGIVTLSRDANGFEVSP